MSADRWSDETVETVAQAIHHPQSGRWVGADEDYQNYCRDRARVVLAVLADAGLLAVPGTTGDAEAWRHNAKLHNDMRRRIQRVATHAAAEQRSLSWVADELTDILDDPQAWRGETARTDASHPTAASPGAVSPESAPTAAPGSGGGAGSPLAPGTRGGVP